ncbi:unnamed protein product [Prunus armeniaca]
MVYEYEGGWSVHLPDALWAYRTSSRSATGFSPYSLVYGSDAISPIEITIPTARIEAVNDLEWDTKAVAEKRTALYHRTVAQAYNRTVKPRAFKQGDLVLKVVEHVRRQVSAIIVRNGKARLQSKRFTAAAIIAWSLLRKAR